MTNELQNSHIRAWRKQQIATVEAIASSDRHNGSDNSLTFANNSSHFYAYRETQANISAAPAKFDVIEWMAEHGHQEYANQIHDCLCTRNEIIGEAGRYWHSCEFTQRTLAKINAEIEDIRQRAADRYEDWATD